MVRSRLTRGLLLLAGWLAVLAGLLGIILPVLPTTPFLLLAAICFSRSSERLHHWMTRHRWLGPPIRQWQESGTLTRDNKRRALILIFVSFSLTLYFAPLPDPGRLALAIMAIFLIWMVARLPQTLTETREDQGIRKPEMAADYEQ